MKLKTFIKKFMVTFCIATLCVCMLSGCGKKDDKVVLNVGQHQVCEKELMVYCLLELLNGQNQYMNMILDENQQRANIISRIREVKTMYDVAKAENLEFTEEDIATRDGLIESFESYVTQDVLDIYGITHEDIAKVFEQTTYVDKYENDKKNELGKGLAEQYMEEYKDYNFQSLYFMYFPTVEVDAEGAPATDENGNTIPLSETDKEKVYNDALAAAEAVNSGTNHVTVATQYGVEAIAEETNGYVGMYSDELNTKLGALKAGQCTEVMEDERCYYIIVVTADHDQGLLESYSNYMAEQEYESEYAALVQEKVAAMGYDDTKDFVGDTWKEFVLIEMAKELYDRGIMY